MEVIPDTLPKLSTAVRLNKTPVAGSVVFINHNANPQDGKPFAFDVGIMVAPETQAVGDFKVKKLDTLKCDTILINGEISGISEAYNKLMQFVAAKKHELTGEVGEYYLYWEGQESPNNVIQIQMGTK